MGKDHLLVPDAIPWKSFTSEIIPSEREEADHAIIPRPERDQWLKPWAVDDERRLFLEGGRTKNLAREGNSVKGPKKLGLSRSSPTLVA
jgi:hypothetical protein